MVVTAGARAAPCGCKPSLQATALENGIAPKGCAQGRGGRLKFKLLDPPQSLEFVSVCIMRFHKPNVIWKEASQKKKKKDTFVRIKFLLLRNFDPMN